MVRVGIGRVDITPELGMRMLGMPDTPRAFGVAWPLQGTVVLAETEGDRAAIACIDLIGLQAEQVAALRGRLAAAGGLDPARIMIACSHTHRAPFTGWADDDEQAVDNFIAGVYDRLAEATAVAAATLEPATLDFGKSRTQGWAFNRRPMYAGGEVGTHGWAWAEGFTGMEGIPDEEVWVLTARRPDGTPIGGLVGFACHPTAMGHDPVYSADYPGVLRAELEARHGGAFGFLLGAAGDTSTPDPASRNPESGFGRTHTIAMGSGIADKADTAMAGAEVVDGSRLRVGSTRLQIPQRLATPELVELARWYLEERPADLDELAFTRRFYGHDHTFADGKQVGNERHAHEMLRMWEWQQGPDAQLVEEVEIQAIALGDVALVAFPVELFTAFGERLKAESPFPRTVVATLANGWHGYAPTLEAFARGGYEPRFAYPSRLVPEAGDMMTDAALELLGSWE
jgi:hypothetical protein